MTSASTSSIARTVPERGWPSTADSSPSSSPGPGNARITSRPSLSIAAFTWPSRSTSTAPASSPWWNRTSPRRYRRREPSSSSCARSSATSSPRNPSATSALRYAALTGWALRSGSGYSSSVPQRVHSASYTGTTFPHVGHRRWGSSCSTRYSTAATSPTKGTIAAIRNQRKNELPLMRPTMPPARPKHTAMMMNATGPAGSASEQRAGGPHHGHDRHDHGDEPGDAGDDADDDLEQEPRGESEDERGEDAHPERGTGLLFHASECTPPPGPGTAGCQSRAVRNRAGTSRGAARPPSWVRARR